VGDPSCLMLDGKVIASNRLSTGFILLPATGLSGAGAVTITGAVAGDTVVSVIDTNTSPFVSVSASFETTISVTGQIQETASVSGHGILVFIIPRS